MKYYYEILLNFFYSLFWCNKKTTTKTKTKTTTKTTIKSNNRKKKVTFSGQYTIYRYYTL